MGKRFDLNDSMDIFDVIKLKKSSNNNDSLYTDFERINEVIFLNLKNQLLEEKIYYMEREIEFLKERLQKMENNK